MILDNSFGSEIILISPLNLNISFDFLNNFLNVKVIYFVFVFSVGFFFSNISKYRSNYGFNFFSNYFRTLSDLSEQEYGSYDDFKFFLMYLVQLFIWFCWVAFVGYSALLNAESSIMLLLISVVVTILTIPTRLLWDFGLAFGMYIRGAANSSNLIVESFFDIIAVVIIFTRFIVQNIRYLLVFVAYFELFEWSTTSNDLLILLKINVDSWHLLSVGSLDMYNFLALVVCSFKVILIYSYHLVHLVIVSFMQIGVYLMVSFWLFFFLYTSFFKVTLDSYFFYKRS